MLVRAAYPIIYYLSVVFSHFRYLIDPIVYVLAGYGLQIIGELIMGKIRNRSGQQTLPDQAG